MLKNHEESVLRSYLNAHYKRLEKTESKIKNPLYKKESKDSFGVFSINKRRKELYVNGDVVNEITKVISYDEKRSIVPLNIFIRKWFIDFYGEANEDFKVVNVYHVTSNCGCKAAKKNLLV